MAVAIPSPAGTPTCGRGLEARTVIGRLRRPTFVHFVLRRARARDGRPRIWPDVQLAFLSRAVGAIATNFSGKSPSEQKW